MNTDYSVAAQMPAPMDLLGLPVHAVGVEEVHAFIRRVIANGEKAIALNLNVHCVNLALKNSWLYDFICRAHLVFCDGDGVRWGLKLLGNMPPPKVTYNKWIWQLAAFCERHGYSMFLLGAKPGVAEQAAQALKKQYPGFQIVGFHHGYFQDKGPENENVIAQINNLMPDILLVCFGMPMQERWIYENWERLKVHVFLKGGAALDYASGRLKSAPKWMVRCQIEWLFRFFQDPIRLFSRYVLGNPSFVLRVFLEKWRCSRRNRSEKR